MKVKETKPRNFCTTKIKISTHPYEYIKKTSIHHWVDWQGELVPLHPLEWVALSLANSILVEWQWHIMASIWNMMQMS
jgi:hypothetical protein